jgi:DNA invertase Pin-like site-specific DNA recombinase
VLETPIAPLTTVACKEATMASRSLSQSVHPPTAVTRAAIYERVLTLNGQNPDVQTCEIEEYCQRRGFEIFSVYLDRGVSGRKDSRPQLNRMMEDAHHRRFEVVVVARFDRFARSVSHLLRALETFNALGIQFVSLAEQVDTSTPTGKMIFTVLGAVSELERNLIVERVHSGLRHARTKGKRLGRSRKIVDAARIAALRTNGKSWRMTGSPASPLHHGCTAL